MIGIPNAVLSNVMEYCAGLLGILYFLTGVVGRQGEKCCSPAER